MHRHLRRGWLALLGCAACGFDPGDPPLGSGGQTEYQLERFPASRNVFVLIVDDAPTPEGQALRLRVAEAFRSQALAEEAERKGGAGCPVDPGRLYVGDAEVVIVRPSYTGDEALVTSVDLPGLAWASDSPTTEQAAAWGQAVAEGLTGAVAPPGSQYRPLERLDDVLSLVFEGRAPVTALERAFVDGLPADPKNRGFYSLTAHVFIATTRDDESPNAVSTYARLDRYGSPSSTAVRPFVLRYPKLYLPTENESCGEARDVPGRFGQWLSEPSQLWLEASDYRCAELAIERPGDHNSACDIFRCTGRPVQVDEAGRSFCIAYAEIDAGTACPNDQGWFDPAEETPELAARTTVGGAYVTRLCEVRELSGKALDACRFDLSCSGCEPGWCVTEVPELLKPSRDCPLHEPLQLPFRFVGDLPRKRERFHLRCNYSDG